VADGGSVGSGGDGGPDGSVGSSGAGSGGVAGVGGGSGGSSGSSGSGGTGGTLPTCPAGGAPDAGGGVANPWLGYLSTASNVAELWAVETVNGAPAAPVKLSGSLPSSADVSQYKWSPDGSKVAYLADADTDNLVELYLVSMPAGTPSPPRKISAPMVAAHQITSFEFAPDGSGLVYLIDTGIPRDLYYVRFCPGSAPLPAQRLSSIGFVWTATFSPDSSRLAYSRTNGSVEEIFVVDLRGPLPGAPARIEPTRRTYAEFDWSRDSRFIHYRAVNPTSLREELFTLDVTAQTPSPVRVNPSTGQDVLSGPAWLPDQSGIVYRMEEDVANVGIFVRRLTGSTLGANYELNTPIMTSAQSTFLVAPDSRRVAFKEDRGVPNDVVWELFYGDFRGGTPIPAVMINGALTTGGDVGSFGFSPDSRFVAYEADANVNGVNELFLVDVSSSSPGAAQRVNGALVSGGAVLEHAFAPDGSGIVYRADEATDGRPELWWASLSPSPVGAVRLNTPITTSGGIVSFTWRSDSTALAFTGTQGNATTSAIYVVEFGGGGPGSTYRVDVQPGTSTPVSGSAAWRP
jgi:Tol biopolymer transport system component